jgi:tetratricopeptide (TPR) repeat protein
MTARAELEKGRSYFERLTHVRPDAVFRMHLVACLGLLSDAEVESSGTKVALDLARRAASEAEDILRKNPQYHPASQGLANQLIREAELLSDIGESDHAVTGLDRAQAILRGLVATYADTARYRADLATAIDVRVRIELDLGRKQGTEARLREAASLAESALRDDSNQISNLSSTASIDADLAAMLVQADQRAEAQSLFSRAFELLAKARARSPGDQEVRRMMVQTLATYAAFLGRHGRISESLMAIDGIRDAGASLTARDKRRLNHTLSDRGFDPVRERAAFQRLMMDLRFPSQPFGGHR